MLGPKNTQTLILGSILDLRFAIEIEHELGNSDLRTFVSQEQIVENTVYLYSKK